jgi:hypothetical protein
LDDIRIKNISEKEVKNSKDELKNQVEITFQSLKNGNMVNEKITLVGEGSLKVLSRV